MSAGQRLRPLRLLLIVAAGTACGFFALKVLVPAPTAEQLAPVQAPVPKSRYGVPLTLENPNSRTGQGALRRRFPAMPGAQPMVSIGEKMISQRVPMNLAAFETKKSDVEVLEFYAKEFDARGLPWRGVKENLEATLWPAISATDANEDVQLSVIAMKHEHGTTVILGLADMAAFWASVHAGEKVESPLPVFPGTEPEVFRATDEGGESTMVTFHTDAGVGQLEAFYDQQLSKRGFVAAQSGVPHQGRVRRRDYTGPPGAWVIYFSKSASGTLVTAQGLPR